MPLRCLFYLFLLIVSLSNGLSSALDVSTCTEENSNSKLVNINEQLQQTVTEINVKQRKILIDFLEQNSHTVPNAPDNPFPRTYKREDNKVNVYLISTFSLHFDSVFLTHFIEHYLSHSIDPSHFFFNIHLDYSLSFDEQENDFKIFQNYFLPLFNNYNIKNYLLWYGYYSTTEMKFTTNKLEKFIPKDGWVIRLDSDEFLSLPPALNRFFNVINQPAPNLFDLINLLDEFGINYLKGHFVDRFAKDCSLQPIIPLLPFDHFYSNNSQSLDEFDSNHILLSYHSSFISSNNNTNNTNNNDKITKKSIFQQFPVKSNFTKDIVHNQKASISRSNLRTTLGNHCLFREKICSDFQPANVAPNPSRFENPLYYATLSPDNIEKFFNFLVMKCNVESEKFSSHFRGLIYVNLDEINLKYNESKVKYVWDLQLEVNHFKWNQIVRDKLRKRIADYRMKGYLWRNESIDLLTYFDEDGRAIKPIDGCP